MVVESGEALVGVGRSVGVTGTEGVRVGSTGATVELSGVGDVGQWSLVVAGRGEVQGGPGFILLATRVDAASGNDASGEELQDHACRVLTGAGAALERVR